ncbi:hypothetical protein LC593_30175 [Nostoc sp. CHAB 5844]|nr:hypothetical protein [Nostoc sp. CHAB 5844]
MEIIVVAWLACVIFVALFFKYFNSRSEQHKKSRPQTRKQALLHSKSSQENDSPTPSPLAEERLHHNYQHQKNGYFLNVDNDELFF